MRMIRLESESMRSYYQMSFHTAARSADEAAGILVANGARGCAVQRGARLGPRSNKIVVLDAYFDRLGASKERAIRRAMETAGMLAAGAVTQPARRIVDPGWTTMWKDRFHPIPVGDRFLIAPPWDRASQSPRITIVINPGQAFGTGHHATTAGAIGAIEELCAKRKFASALDVGTGSGILALAMKLMGIGKVAAIDNDAAALVNARENAALNRLTRRIAFSTTALARIRGRYELVTANILSSVLIRLASDLKRVLARNGCLVLGGILRRETAQVAAAFTPELRMLRSTTRRGWVTMVLVR